MPETLTEAQEQLHQTKYGCLFALSITLEYVDVLKHGYRQDNNPYLTNCCSGVERTSTALFNAIQHEVLKGLHKAEKEKAMASLAEMQEFIFSYFSLGAQQRDRLSQIVKEMCND